MSFRSSIRTVEVSGAITTVTGTAPVAPTITKRAQVSAATQSVNSLTFTIPASTVAGDLLVLNVWFYPSSGTFTAPSGWTLANRTDFPSQGTSCVTCTRVAQSGDAGTNVGVNLPDQGGSGTLTVFAGATTYTAGASNGSIGSNAQVSITSGSINTGQMILVSVGSGTNPHSANVSWPATGSGGPPATQPTWAAAGAPDGAVPSRNFLATANWTPATAYPILVQQTGPGSAAAIVAKIS